MKATENSVITIEYTLKNDKGETIDSSEKAGPFTYIQGMEQTLEGMEEILDGKEEDFTFDGLIPCDKAYGKKDDEFHIPVPTAEFENLDDLKVGGFLTIMNNYDEPQDMEIVAIDDENVTIDANSPYADMDIKFTCKVLEVREATEEELQEAKEELEDDHHHEHGDSCGCE